MSCDPRARFSAAADDYHRHRPAYPPELVPWVAQVTGLPAGAPIADVGCGTGISTRLFAAAGYSVVGVDPNEEMLARAREAGLAEYRRGESASTGLPEAGYDLVTVGQALHWLDVPVTLLEFRRILKPSGWCCAFWNLRAPCPLQEEYERLLLEHSTEYRAVPRPDAAIRALHQAPEVTSLREAEFPNAQVLDRSGFLGRVHSSSYVAHGVRDRGTFDAALGALFDRHQSDGRVRVPYRTLALLWQLLPGLSHEA